MYADASAYWQVPKAKLSPSLIDALNQFVPHPRITTRYGASGYHTLYTDAGSAWAAAASLETSYTPETWFAWFGWLLRQLGHAPQLTPRDQLCIKAILTNTPSSQPTNLTLCAIVDLMAHRAQTTYATDLQHISAPHLTDLLQTAPWHLKDSQVKRLYRFAQQLPVGEKTKFLDQVFSPNPQQIAAALAQAQTQPVQQTLAASLTRETFTGQLTNTQLPQRTFGELTPRLVTGG